jgi:hypothetical protein
VEEKKPEEAEKPKSLFGGATFDAPKTTFSFTTPSANTSNGSSLFGNSSSLFTAPVGAPQAGNSLFGGSAAPLKPTTGALFGGSAAPSGGLFGNVAQPATGSLFAPGTSTLFGQPATGQPSLFANSGNLFGKPAEPSKNDDGSGDEGPIKADDEPPSYAIEG